MNNIFDLYTEEYDNWFDKNYHAYLTELLALKREIPNGKKGVEIGIGTGRFAQMLNIHCGIDLSKKMLKIAKDRGCKVALADAKDLPFRTNEFDCALLMVTLCFVDNSKKVVKETKRIITKSGKIIIGIIDRNSRLGKYYQQKKAFSIKLLIFYHPTK